MMTMTKTLQDVLETLAQKEIENTLIGLDLSDSDLEYSKLPSDKNMRPKDSPSETGAVRSADANHTRFDLIHPVAMLALARTYHEGGTKYGCKNWEQGMPAHDLLNHGLRHIYMWLAGDRSEPHLPHAAWNVMAAIVSEVLWPHLNEKHLRGPGCTLTEAGLAHQEAGNAERKRRRDAGDFDSLSGWHTQDIPEVKTLLQQRQEVECYRTGGNRPHE